VAVLAVDSGREDLMLITSLHQLELTSFCNLRCGYCPSASIVAGKHPNRPAVHMTRETFQRALEWVKHFVGQGTQKELNLAGIGESTLHPDLVDFVRLAREAVGPNVNIVFATNGLLVTEELAKALAPYKPEVWVSLHQPEKAVKADRLLRKAGIAGQMSIDPVTGSNDWAGQVPSEWKGTYKFACPWGNNLQAFVYADGSIGSCCLDSTGVGKFGHVNDAIGSLTWKPSPHCAKCYQVLPAHFGVAQA
jgi:hypothetical protein